MPEISQVLEHQGSPAGFQILLPSQGVVSADLPPREGRCVSAPVQLVNTVGGGSAEPACAYP